jgi:hypothetical protein
VQLTPSPASRLAHAGLGVAAGALGVGVAQDGFAPEAAATILAALLVCLGLVIVIRSALIGVDCRDGQVRVRGLLLTRVVPRASVYEVTGFPALLWRDSGGRRRWTPVVFLMDSPRALPRFRQENFSNLVRLRRWIAEGRR